MGTNTDLLTGIATMIAAAIPSISWDPNPAHVYPLSATGIMLKFTSDKPDRLVVLTAVNQGNDITMPNSKVMVQVKGRGLPNQPTDVDDLLDSILDVLHGTKNLTFGSVNVTQMNCTITVPNGFDAAQRWERFDHYDLDISTPPTSLRPESGSW